MRSGRPRALVLDALGTLVELEPPAPILAAVLGERFGLQISALEAQRAITAEIDYYRAHLAEGRDATGLAVLRSRCAEVLRTALPPRDGVAELENAALTQALLASLRFTAFADARPAILAARGLGLRVVVASNWDISLRDLLERLGIAPLLDGIVTSAEIGAAKPSPRIFLRALELAGVRPDAAVHVGDSLEEDVTGALAAGIEPILLVRDGGPGPRGVRTVGSLDGLTSLI